MNLGQQFQVILFSLLFGMIFLACYDIFNRTFYKIRGKLVRFVLELIFFSVLSTIYFFILFLINDAILSIYMPLFLILGGFIYMKFLSFPLLCIYEKIVGKIEHKLSKIHLFFMKRMQNEFKKKQPIKSKIKIILCIAISCICFLMAAFFLIRYLIQVI